MEDTYEHYKISSGKLALITAATGMATTRVRAIIMYPWPEREVHQLWLDEAEPDEIASWVRHVASQEEAEIR